MSERERDDFRPSSGTLVLFVVVILALIVMLFELGGKITDLQRRVGQLEEQVRR